MANWLERILGNGKGVAEWRTENSIFGFLSNNLETSGKLKEAANDLPDENRDDENKIRFAPGLTDAMFGQDDSDSSKKRTNELIRLLTKVAKHGDKRAEGEYYLLVNSEDGVIGIIDDFLGNIVDLGLPVQPYLIGFSKDLALRTDKRNGVKFGIALLGLCQDKTVIDELKVLGLHDEFTIYVTVALSNLSDHIQRDLWDLAKKVDGWGKIQLVDRLATMDLIDEQRDWLIREGYKNSIMYEYLAYTCALNGQLHEKLGANRVDREFFRSSGDIIEALIAGGPAEDISNYTYAASVVKNFIRHAKEHTSDIPDFLTLNHIKDFLDEIQNDFEDHKSNGWTDEIISDSIIEIGAVLDERDWRDLTRDALSSSDNVTYWNGKQAAEILGIDLWKIVWQKLSKNPLDFSAWYDVTHYAKTENADAIIEFALRNLPFEELGTGPTDSLGLGEEFMKYQALDTITTFLEDYPGCGEQIVLTSLNSPVTRNRNMAIRVLEKWKKDNWSTKIRQQIEKLRSIEPNDETKTNIERLLNGDVLI